MDPLPESWPISARPEGAPLWVPDPKRRPHTGVRLAPGVDATDPLVRVRAASYVVPAHGVLGGWAAAAVHGVPPEWIDGRRGREPLDVPVVVAPPARARSRRGISVTAGRLDDGDVTVVRGLTVTSGTRTAFDLMRHAADLPEAVAMGDACVRHRLTSRSAVVAYAEERPGWKGVALARRAAPVLDGRAESPPESKVRVHWLDGGLGVPIPQVYVLAADGTFLGRVDLFDPEAGVAGEYMGALHREGRRPWLDTRRRRGLEGVGVEVVEWWNVDLPRPEEICRSLALAYRLAARRRADEKTYRFRCSPGPE